MKDLVKWIGVLLVIAIACVILGAVLTGSPEKRASALAITLAAQTAASESRAATRQMEADRAMNRAQQMLPYVIMAVVACVFLALVVLIVVEHMATRREKQQLYLPPPTFIIIGELPPRQRLEAYREIEAQVHHEPLTTYPKR